MTSVSRAAFYFRPLRVCPASGHIPFGKETVASIWRSSSCPPSVFAHFIPRQEDIGFDFSCSIADQEAGILTFGYPYLISIKSRSTPSIDIEPTKTAIEADDARHVAWLFRQDQPVFLGVVDKDAISLRIFSLLPIWFLYYRGGPTVGSLSLNPRFDPAQFKRTRPH